MKEFKILSNPSEPRTLAATPALDAVLTQKRFIHAG